MFISLIDPKTVTPTKVSAPSPTDSYDNQGIYNKYQRHSWGKNDMKLIFLTFILPKGSSSAEYGFGMSDSEDADDDNDAIPDTIDTNDDNGGIPDKLEDGFWILDSHGEYEYNDDGDVDQYDDVDKDANNLAKR